MSPLSSARGGDFSLLLRSRTRLATTFERLLQMFNMRRVHVREDLYLQQLKDDGQACETGSSSCLQRIAAGMQVVEEGGVAGYCVVLLLDHALQGVERRHL